MNSSPKLLRKVSLILCFVIGAALGIPALEAIAADTPCSGRKGGIAGGDLVLCKDGSISMSSVNGLACPCGTSVKGKPHQTAIFWDINDTNAG